MREKLKLYYRCRFTQLSPLRLFGGKNDRTDNDPVSYTHLDVYKRQLEHIVVQAPAHQRGQGAGLLFVQVAELLFKALVQQVVKQGVQLIAGDVGVL